MYRHLHRAFVASASAAIAAFTLSAVQPASAQDVNPAGHDFPQISLPAKARSAQIIGALGSRLPEVARFYGMTEADFRALVQRDKSIFADRSGRLAYACKGIVPEEGPALGAATNTTTTAATTSAALTVADTFAMHSRPASTRKVYLDFNGHTTSNTIWNTNYTGGSSFTTPPYDVDGDPSTFSTDELARIQDIWRRVVEDFSAFDVDVTTEDPGADALRRSTTSDQAYGIRVCIGGSSYDWFQQGAGGVAYVGSFNWNTDTPCYIFTAQLAGGVEKYTAEAASHEVGHSLGLSHDGQAGGTEYYAGQGNWAPIMGNSYYQEVTQWSKGEYPNASNTQDDLAVMQSYGATLRADEAGDSVVSAAALSGSNPVVSGVIATRNDVDLYRFNTDAGTVSFQTTSATVSPDLDVLLALYDGSGRLIVSNDQPGLPGFLSADLPAGTYYLAVDGTSPGDAINWYNDYASIGAYQLSGTILAPATANQPPVAVASASTTTGVAPVTVTFSSQGSLDPDGTIASYDWDFGDGSEGVSAPTATHVYSTPGVYTASLIVTDAGGLTGIATATVTVTDVAQSISVSSLNISVSKNGGGTMATATVTVRNSGGALVSGVAVSGVWSGLATGNASGITGTNGQISFSTKRVKSSGTFSFTVKNLSLNGTTYDPGQNTTTTASITTP